MNTKLLFLLRYTLFWMVYFFFGRLLFLIYNYQETREVASVQEVLKIFGYGLKMDASVSGYFLLLPVVFFIVNSFFNTNFFNPFIKPYTFILLFFSSIFIMTDLRIFRHWGYRLDISPFLFLKDPGEAVGFITISEIAIGIPAIFIFTFVFYSLFKKILKPKSVLHEKSRVIGPVTFLVTGILLIIPIRGGLGLSTLNESSVYFSKNNYCNQAAINVFWNVAHSITEISERQKSYEHIPAELAHSIVNELYRPVDLSRKVIKTKRPNIILVIMESMTRKLLYNKMDEVIITPYLNHYGDEGIYFSNFYGSGERTNKGLAAILSGYPAMPQSSVFDAPRKMAKLPSLLGSLKSAGYHTSFYYGGDLNFANMKSYILKDEPDILVDKSDFDTKSYDTKWGIHDQVVFEKVTEDLLSADTPFFTTILTLSNHEPFDVPQPLIFNKNDPERLFANAANYADKALHDFIENIRITPQWDNTLIILVADHSTVLPYYSGHYELARFKIPMIWLGGVLDTGQMKISKFGDQTDIATTLLKQLDLPVDKYRFGKDLFAENAPSFAYYTFNKGFGFISDSLQLIYDNKNSDYLVKEKHSNRFPENIGKAHQQVVSQDYFEK